jgi:hypothetical protein
MERASDNNRVLDQLHRWIPLMQQAHEARHYIRRAEELGHPELFHSVDGMLEFLLHFRGALNSYARCFVSAGRGKTRLKKESVFSATPQLLELHQKIMGLRNTYVAHCDDNEIERTGVTTTDTPSELTIRLEYNFSFPFDRLYELRELIQHLVGYIVDSHREHLASVERRIGKPIRILQGE